MSDVPGRADDPASLLATASRAGAVARDALRPGILDLIVLAVARFIAFAPTSHHLELPTALMVAGSVAGVVLVGLSAVWVRRRYGLGGRIGRVTWVAAAAALVATAASDIALHGHAARAASGLEFGIIASALGAYYRSALILVVAGVAVLAGVAAGLHWSTLVTVSVCVAWFAAAVFVGRRQFLEEFHQ